MRILVILLIFLFINNCSNQNFSSFLKKKNDDMVEKPNLDIDKNISFEDFKNKIIILSAIDNLIKGGSGQAVQNMNILFGYKSDEGLNWWEY